ncbi:MAG: sugar phosphate isomerase/epimerase family protein [Planctomycetota bacterium]|jgi:sugar phosphate isomerase/epimerase
MKFAMCNEFCEGWAFRDACALAAEAGYDGIEIAPFTLSDSVEDIAPETRAELRQTAAQAGLEVVGLHWLLVKPEGLHINSPDPHLRARTAEYLRAEIGFCADLGGTTMVLGSPKQRDVLPAQSYEEVWERSVRLLRGLSEQAAERGGRLCIEPLSRQETNFVTTAAEARALVEAVDHDAFCMILDVKAMHADEEPIPEIIRKSAPYLAHFHANDANLRGPGSGQTDFAPIACALHDIGYGGYVSVEVFDFSDGSETIARGSLAYLKEVFE